jgi:hypothetical protein
MTREEYKGGKREETRENGFRRGVPGRGKLKFRSKPFLATDQDSPIHSRYPQFRGRKKQEAMGI